MNHRVIPLVAALLLPGIASANDVAQGDRPAAAPGLEVGVGAAPPRDSRPGVQAARPVPAGLVGNLDFRLDQPRRLKAATLSSHLDRAHANAQAETGGHGLRIGPELSYISTDEGYLGPYVGVSNRTNGETHEQQINGALTRSFGMAMTVDNTVLLLSYDRTDAPLAGIDPEDLFAAASNRLAPDVTLTFYGMRGLSRGSADAAVGTAITFSFTR